MSKNFVTYLTAENCGHCLQTRGKGILNDGKVLNGTDFLNKIFNYNMEIVNIHYNNMMGNKGDIKDVSRFYLKEGIIYQEKYSNAKGELRVEVYSCQKNKTSKIQNNYVFKNNQKVRWGKFLKERIPDKLANYVFYFPCFLIIERKNWAETLKDSKADLIALTNAGITYKDEKENIGLKKTSESINKRNVDIIKLIEDVEKGVVKIEPIESPKERIEKNINKAVEKFIEHKDIIIKGA